MEHMKIRERFRGGSFAAGCALLAAVVTIGSTVIMQDFSRVAEIPEYAADPVLTVSVEEDETPLASAPKVSTKTSSKTKTTQKKVKLKSKSKKTYTKKLPVTKKVSTKTVKKNATTTVKTETTVRTATTEKYQKKSNKKLVTKKVTTTVKTTTTVQQQAVSNSAAVFSDDDGAAVVQTSSQSASQSGKYEVDVAKIAPQMDKSVIYVYKKLGFKVVIDFSVHFAGHFDARNRVITLQREDDTIYHELGHFLAFAAGGADKNSFTAVYNREKDKYQGVNVAYATQNSSEYFAESVKDYVQNPVRLKGSRSETYTAIQNAIGKMTDAQISKLQSVYGPIWR